MYGNRGLFRYFPNYPSHFYTPSFPHHLKLQGHFPFWRSSATEEASLQNDQSILKQHDEHGVVIFTPLNFQALRHHGETGSSEVAKRRPAVVIPISVESGEATTTF